jgi:two-component system KDP operon response regulator KdpE
MLRDADFEVLAAQSVADALEAASLHPPDAAILDLVLPDGSGVEICRSLREWSSMPILMLSAVGQEDAKVEALEAGADDYVEKPFSPRELIARLNAILRRSAGGDEAATIVVGDLELDLTARVVRLAGEEVRLTPTEYDLLRTLATNRGRVMTHRTLLTEIWGPNTTEDTRTLRTHVANLRKKIEPKDPGEPSLIRTDAGVGYRFGA